MPYRKSILFDKSVVDDLNNVFSLLEPYCYFAAYYSPKKAFGNNHEANFWLAVINGYSLIQECSRFLWGFIQKNNNINNYLATNGDEYYFFYEKERRRISDFFWFLKRLRSIYCHNQFPCLNNNENVDFVMRNINQYLKNASFTADRYDIKDGYIVCKKGQINQDMWKELASAICHEAEVVTVIIKKAVEASLRNDSVKSLVVDCWREKVIGWYLNSNGECKDYVYAVANSLATSFYRGKVLGKRDLIKSKTSSYVNRYNNMEHIPSQNSSYKELIKSEMNDIIQEMDGPAMPLEVIAEVMTSHLFNDI